MGAKKPTWDVRKGRCKGGGQSSKAKGRNACLQVRDLMLGTFAGLQPDDILVKATSQGGVDLHLSPAAHEYFPYAIEVKCAEALNIWAALTQAETNAGDGEPVVFFKRAFTPMFVALRADEFVSLLSLLHRLKEQE